MQRGEDYVAPTATIRHVHEFLQLMAAMTGDHRYEEIYSTDMERRQVNMCEVLDRVENRGIEKGMQQGIQIGITKGESSTFSFVQFLVSNNRMEDLKRTFEDIEYREKLMTEFSTYEDQVQ